MHQKDYIKIRPEAPGVRAKDLIFHYWELGNRESEGALRLKAPSGGGGGG